MKRTACAMAAWWLTGCAALGSVPKDAGEVAARVHPLTVEACNACEEACAVAHGLCSE